MTAAEKLEEIAKFRKYLDEAEALLAKAGIYGCEPLFNKFDVIAMALVSKSFSVARACLLLLDNGFEDEAYGMSRSVVECAWTLRYLTQTPAEVESRTWKYFNYVILDKFWIYHALMRAKDEETKSDIRAHGEELGLHDDPTEVVGHWSGKNGFGWIVNQMEHPLDGLNTNEAIKSAEYAVDYHQPSAFVHCYEPAIENFVPQEKTPFKVKRADGDGGQPDNRFCTFVADPTERKQSLIFELTMSELGAPEAARQVIARRLSQLGAKTLRDGAPYATSITQVMFAWVALQARGLHGQRKSDMCDLEYLYYAPFCKIFASCDRLHKTLWNAATTTAIWCDGSELLQDLAIRAELRKSDPDRVKGLRPIPLEGSVITRIFEQLGRQ